MQSLYLPAAQNPASLSPAQIIDIINRVNGGARIRTRYQWLSDKSRLPVPGLTPPLMQACSITCDTTQAVHRSLSSTLLEPIGVNVLRHLLQVWVQFCDVNWNTRFEVPVGLFRPSFPARTISSAQTVWAINGLDLTQDLARLTFGYDYTVPMNTNYVQLMTVLCAMDALAASRGALGARQPTSNPYVWPDSNDPGKTPGGLDSEGPNWPRSRMQFQPDQHTSITPQTYSRDSNFQAAVNSVADAITYYHPWTDEWGMLHSSLRPEYSFGPPPIGWAYADGPAGNIAGPLVQQFTPQAQMANVAQVSSQPSNGPALFAEQANTSTGSAINLQNWGATVRTSLRDDTIPTQDLANRRCTILLQDADSVSDVVQFPVPLNPFFQSYDAVTINKTSRGVPKIQSSAATPYLITAWSMDLQTLAMSVTASRITAL